MTLTLASSSSEPLDRPAAVLEALSFHCAPQQIEDMVERGVPFFRIEEAIDATLFVHSHKAALWLLAWSLQDSGLQREEAREMAYAVTAHGQASSDERLCAAPDLPAEA